MTKGIIVATLASAVTAAFVSVPAVQAITPEQRIAQLERQVKRLKSKNQFLREQNDRATAAIADFKRQVALVSGERDRLAADVSRFRARTRS